MIVALIILGGAAWFAFDSDKRIRKFARSTDLIPGKPGRAPEEWSTGTSREAQLHQRIRYAIADVHANPGIPSDQRLVADRDRLDQAVFDLDDRLIAAAGTESATTSEEEKTASLDSIEAAIKVLEELPKKLWEAPSDDAHRDIEATISRLDG